MDREIPEKWPRVIGGHMRTLTFSSSAHLLRSLDRPERGSLWPTASSPGTNSPSTTEGTRRASNEERGEMFNNDNDNS